MNQSYLSKLLILGIFLTGFLASAAAEDLIVDGETVTMDGKHTYDKVKVINGGVIEVKDIEAETYLTGPYNDQLRYRLVGGTGVLNLSAEKIIIDENSRIDADQAGYPAKRNLQGADWDDGFSGIGPGSGGGGRGGDDCFNFGAGRGGGGAGYGGKGQSGGGIGGGGGGSTYGSESKIDARKGSSGGSGGSADGGANGGGGGDGGGAIELRADTIKIKGTITAKGGNGGNGGDSEGCAGGGGGGGSGGGILLSGKDVTLSESALSVKGGRGGSGGTSTGSGYGTSGFDGGDGAGGRIKVFAGKLKSLTRYEFSSGTGGAEKGTINNSYCSLKGSHTVSGTETFSSVKVDDLNVYGKAVMNGNITAKDVDVASNGAIQVNDKQSIIARYLNIGSNSKITASKTGYRDGPGTGGYNTGGSYGGKGGDYSGSWGGSSSGSTYGSKTSNSIWQGSGGGSEYSIGGGAIKIYTRELTNNGKITSRGKDGGQTTEYVDGDSYQVDYGGGSGGGILITTKNADINGKVLAQGGAKRVTCSTSDGGWGSDGGTTCTVENPSGGGGRIKVFYDSLTETNTEYNVTGANDGTLHKEQVNRDKNPFQQQFSKQSTCTSFGLQEKDETPPEVFIDKEEKQETITAEVACTDTKSKCQKGSERMKIYEPGTQPATCPTNYNEYNTKQKSKTFGDTKYVCGTANDTEQNTGFSEEPVRVEGKALTAKILHPSYRIVTSLNREPHLFYEITNHQDQKTTVNLKLQGINSDFYKDQGKTKTIQLSPQGQQQHEIAIKPQETVTENLTVQATANEINTQLQDSIIVEVTGNYSTTTGGSTGSESDDIRKVPGIGAIQIGFLVFISSIFYLYRF